MRGAKFRNKKLKRGCTCVDGKGRRARESSPPPLPRSGLTGFMWAYLDNRQRTHFSSKPAALVEMQSVPVGFARGWDEEEPSSRCASEACVCLCAAGAKDAGGGSRYCCHPLSASALGCLCQPTATLGCLCQPTAR